MFSWCRAVTQMNKDIKRVYSICAERLLPRYSFSFIRLALNKSVHRHISSSILVIICNSRLNIKLRFNDIINDEKKLMNSYTTTRK